ncbi:XIAP-associated factor 1 [Solea senegalensis]|uniref:XIAP-associated factor 1 n=1 Tax=Solea senegalensis TaxID=28829 RepID=A0AAV6PX54_SOLSE|nr:XIAP-associated factor 1 [Solea senegalensis]KAG7479614.1 XIAP-associated factor 1 [Solea senegalensis]
MDNKEETRTCSKCHREIAEANFALHETHCSRFLCLCPDCDEAVPTEQLSQHREEQHTQVRCSMCHQKMERCQLKDHEADECVERLHACHFCDLELPWKELDQHCVFCGSRTELCRDCGRYVKLSDLPSHASTCSAAAADATPPQTTSTSPKKTTVTVNCSKCTASFPAEDADKHECVSVEDDSEDEDDEFPREVSLPQLSSIYRAASLSDRTYTGPWRDEDDPDQISSCPHCHLALPLFSLRRHEAKCKIYIHLN